MTLDEIFEAYYNLYRAEATTPASTDDEYTIAVRLFNEAVNRWSVYDGTYWKELFTTLQVEEDGDLVVASATTEYETPSNFKEAGGFVKIKDSDGNTVRNYPIIEPQDAQFKNDASTYCYFTGDPGKGYALHLNPVPDSSIVGMDIDYVYYKKPTLLASANDVTEMADPYFIVNRALANRFRASRNPYYNSAKTDAEDCLRIMQMTNNSGSWADPWKLADNSGAVFGVN